MSWDEFHHPFIPFIPSFILVTSVLVLRGTCITSTATGMSSVAGSRDTHPQLLFVLFIIDMQAVITRATVVVSTQRAAPHHVGFGQVLGWLTL